MAAYSNTTKKPGQYAKGLREHWRNKRLNPHSRDKRNTAVNDCWKPSLGASKADLAEFHAENMKLRRREQLKRVANVSPIQTKNDDPAYRKSIWPAAKIARKSA